ncbi:MAG: DUF3859 domain-containing protein [Verrucomicrobiota bacterium]
MKIVVINFFLSFLLLNSYLSNVYGNSVLPLKEPVHIISYGIYEMVPEVSDGKTSQKSDDIGYPRFIEQTDKIPAKLGTRFGFSFAVFGLDRYENGEKIALRRVIKHPSITSKTGVASTGHEYMENYEVLHGAVVGGTGYLLEKHEELVPGKWTFEYWLEGNRLLSKSFEVFKPSN